MKASDMWEDPRLLATADQLDAELTDWVAEYLAFMMSRYQEEKELSSAAEGVLLYHAMFDDEGTIDLGRVYALALKFSAIGIKFTEVTLAFKDLEDTGVLEEIQRLAEKGGLE